MLGQDAEAGTSEITALRPRFGGASTAKFLSLRVVGPGLLACLADTDSGCLLVAAQSGAKWGYSLLPLQLVLIPVLYSVQELTVRLGTHLKQGHAACIRDTFGTKWASLACAFLVVSCTGGMISELSGVASVMELWGASHAVGTLGAAVAIVATVTTLNYRQVEAVAVTLGLCEITFIITMCIAHPPAEKVFRGMFVVHSEASYWKLFSSNIGAVIMPWMIFFQQSAIVARRLASAQDLDEERAMTLAGSLLTQLVMIGTLVTLASAPLAGRDLKSVQDIQRAIEPLVGKVFSMVLVSGTFIGSALCGAVVVSLTAAWAICEVARWEDPFAVDRRITEAPRFYGAFLAIIAVGVCVLSLGVNVVRLNVYIDVVDALLMPMAVCFLWLLSTGPLLPEGLRVKGAHKFMLACVFVTVSVAGLASGIYGLFI